LLCSLWGCERFCDGFGGWGFEFCGGDFLVGIMLVVVENVVEVGGCGFESVEAGF
jgi:hypothetical protein